MLLTLLGRRSSLSDISVVQVEDIDVRQRLERLEVDVDLCGQFLELRDKEAKMRHAISIAEVSDHGCPQTSKF